MSLWSAPNWMVGRNPLLFLRKAATREFVISSQLEGPVVYWVLAGSWVLSCVVLHSRIPAVIKSRRCGVTQNSLHWCRCWAAHFWIERAEGLHIFPLLHPNSTLGFPRLRTVLLAKSLFPSALSSKARLQRNFRSANAVSESNLPSKVLGSSVKTLSKA